MISMEELQSCHALTVELVMVKTALFQLKNAFRAPNSTTNMSDVNSEYLESKIRKIERDRASLISELDMFMLSVEDIDIYIFMRLHYLCGFYWDEVAALTGEKSGDAVNTRVYKYCRSVMKSSAPLKEEKADDAKGAFGIL